MSDITQELMCLLTVQHTIKDIYQWCAKFDKLKNPDADSREWRNLMNQLICNYICTGKYNGVQTKVITDW